MARVARRFPSHVLVGQRQGLAVPPPATVTRLIMPQVVALIDETAPRRHIHGGVTQNRWSGYQWVGLPPVTPTPKQFVQDVAQFGAERRSPERASHIVTNRWSGYQWAGLAPVTPAPKQIVQDQAGVWQARQDHRRGLIVEPGVQAAAAAAGTVPVTPPLPRQIVQDQAAFQPRRAQHGGRVIEPGVQLAAASAPPPPTVTPLRTVYVLQAAQQPRPHRRASVIAPRTAQGVVTRPVSTVVVARPPSVQTRRHGCVTAPRRITAPIAPPRPSLVHTPPQRRRRGGSVVALHGRFVQTGVATTLITTPLTGYVSTGDSGVVATGNRGQPSAGDTGLVKTGNTGFPQI